MLPREQENEHGTEAAAISGTFLAYSGIQENPPQPFERDVNHPFAYALVDAEQDKSSS